MAHRNETDDSGPKARTRKVRALTGFTKIAWMMQVKGPSDYIVRMYRESRPVMLPQGEVVISDTLALVQMGVALGKIPIVPEQSKLMLKPVDPNEYRRPVRMEISVEQPGTPLAHGEDEPFAEIVIRLYETDEEPKKVDPKDLPPINVAAR